MLQQTFFFFIKVLQAQHRKLLIFAFGLITQTSNEKYKLKKCLLVGIGLNFPKLKRLCKLE